MRLLRHDLDWIVMKCLEKDRADRYETVSALAVDIRRHADYEPVAARPRKRSYRAWKTVRRHRKGIGLSMLALAMALMAFATMRMLSQELRQQRRTALAYASILPTVTTRSDSLAAINYELGLRSRTYADLMDDPPATRNEFASHPAVVRAVEFVRVFALVEAHFRDLESDAWDLLASRGGTAPERFGDMVGLALRAPPPLATSEELLREVAKHLDRWPVEVHRAVATGDLDEIALAIEVSLEPEEFATGVRMFIEDIWNLVSDHSVDAKIDPALQNLIRENTLPERLEDWSDADLKVVRDLASLDISLSGLMVAWRLFPWYVDPALLLLSASSAMALALAIFIRFRS